MTQDAFDSLASLSNTLRRFCDEGRSGTFHIVTSSNHTAYFGLLSGQIVAVRYRIRKNMRALEHILKISEGSYTFKTDNQVENNAAALPSTAEILALLEGAKAAPASSASPPAPASANAPAATPGSDAAPQQLASSTQALLLNILTHYAGPAANFVARSVFSKTASTSEAIEMLAQKIPNPAKAQAFVEEARSQLGHLL